MKKLFGMFVLATILFACGNASDEPAMKNNTHQVVVKEAINSGGYTYLHVNENGEEKWLAVTEMEAKVGDVLYYEGGMTMANFESKTLNRTFEEIIFLNSIRSSANAMVAHDNQDHSGHNHEGHDHEGHDHEGHQHNVIEELTVEPVEKAEGGISIAELYANKTTYEGKKVKIKGQVTKFNEAILNTNWLHLQDGSEHNGNNDITVKTDNITKVGDIITIEGTVLLDQDLGHGYAFDVLIEKAEIQ